MLKVRSLQTFYGRVHILKALSVHVGQGEIVAVIGANGAGKTTLLRSLAGLVRPSSGAMEFKGEDMTRLSPEGRLKRGLALCPEGRRLFRAMSVKDNLILGAYSRSDRDGIRRDLDRFRNRFPILSGLWHRPAGSLSGGEQQMVALCRALMSKPTMLLLDEPSLGLSPLLSKDILKAIVAMNREEDLGVLIVEQNARAALRIADRAYVLETGRVVLEGSGSDLLDHQDVRRAYLGKGYKEIWER
ncbi:MAG: ABC transporter ATP-binding protein [Deltaproteobacteria bacterium]|nr:ABC transporter ATP-binding protein [Deltaproteobacteria bacterium]